MKNNDKFNELNPIDERLDDAVDSRMDDAKYTCRLRKDSSLGE